MLTNLFTYHPEMSIQLKQQGLDIEQLVLTSWSALGSEEYRDMRGSLFSYYQ